MHTRRVLPCRLVAVGLATAVAVGCASSGARPAPARAGASRGHAGSWRLDRVQSAGLPPDSGSALMMLLRVTPDSVVEELSATRPDGAPEYRRLVYRFDGTLTADTVVNGTKGVFRIVGSAHWQQDTLVLVREAHYPQRVVVLTDRMTVSPDGETLTVAQLASAPASSQRMVLVLRRTH